MAPAANTLAEVYSALAYYYDHKDEIEAYLEEGQRTAAELEAKQAEYLSRHPGPGAGHCKA